MGQLGHSFLVATLLFAGAALHAQQEPAQEQRDPVQEHQALISRVFGEARKLKDSDPQQALAQYGELFRAEPPAGDFDSDSPDAVGASYKLYSNLARMYFDAAMLADNIGQWEKAAEYFTKAGALIVGPAEKVKAAYPRFAEGYENEKRRYIEELESHADEIRALEAKPQSDYTNDDFTALEHVLVLRKGIDVANGAIGYYAERIETAEREAAFYNPEMPYAERTTEKIRLIQEQINKYKGGRGDKAKWVEGVVSDYQKQLPGYATTQEEKIAFAYRLTALSPNSKTAPALLEWLKAKARSDAADLDASLGDAEREKARKEASQREADLKRAIAASRPAPKK